MVDCTLIFPLYYVHIRFPVQLSHLQKCLDDSADVECFSDGQEYRKLVDHIVEWCGNDHLILDAKKKKEMIITFRETRDKPNALSILARGGGGGGGGPQVP